MGLSQQAALCSSKGDACRTDSVQSATSTFTAIRALPDKKTAATPIVAMTANAFEEDRQNALAAGMNGHAAKPIDVSKLMKLLGEILK